MTRPDPSVSMRLRTTSGSTWSSSARRLSLVGRMLLNTRAPWRCQAPRPPCPRPEAPPDRGVLGNNLAAIALPFRRTRRTRHSRSRSELQRRWFGLPSGRPSHLHIDDDRMHETLVQHLTGQGELVHLPQRKRNAQHMARERPAVLKPEHPVRSAPHAEGRQVAHSQHSHRDDGLTRLCIRQEGFRTDFQGKLRESGDHSSEDWEKGRASRKGAASLVNVLLTVQALPDPGAGCRLPSGRSRTSSHRCAWSAPDRRSTQTRDHERIHSPATG